MAPTERAAIFRIRYSGNTESGSGRWLRLDAFTGGSEISIVDPYTVVGISRKNSGGVPANFACYFILQFDIPMADVLLETDTGKTDEGTRVWAACRFDSTEVTVRVASSFISVEQAERNLAEVKGQSFDRIRLAGREAWNKVLGRIHVEGENGVP